MSLEPRTSSLRLVLSAFIFALLTSSLWAAEKSSTKYVVLNVTGQDGKVFHIAKEDKEKDDYRKSLEQEYQKARQAYQDEKKAHQKENPGKKFIPIPSAVCPNMKKTTLEKVLKSLETLEPRIQLSDEVMKKARVPLQRMIDMK